jgi:hypothetical protein
MSNVLFDIKLNSGELIKGCYFIKYKQAVRGGLGSPIITYCDISVNSTKHARYFKQAFYGVPIRMAVLSLVMGKEI